MPEKPVKVRPLWRWAFWRVWCVVALPWLVAAVGYGGYVYSHLDEKVIDALWENSEASTANVLIFQQARHVERILQNLAVSQPHSGSDFKVEQAQASIWEMREAPGLQGLSPFLAAASVWSSTRSAMWIYREHATSWHVVIEPSDPLQPAMLYETTTRHKETKVSNTLVPSEWRIRGRLYEQAVESLQHLEKDQRSPMANNFLRGVAWQYFDKLPHHEKSGFVVMLVTRDAQGGIVGAYGEVASMVGFSELQVFEYGSNFVFAPEFLFARMQEDGRIKPIRAGELDKECSFFQDPILKSRVLRPPDELISSTPYPHQVMDVLARGHIAGSAYWLAGTEGRVFEGEPMLRALYARESALFLKLYAPVIYLLIAFVLTTCAIAFAHRIVLGRFAKTLARDMGEVRRLDVLRGPYYFPKTRIAELVALREAVEEAAAGLDKREAAVKDPVMLEAVVRAVPVEREGEEGGAPTQNVPLAPPVAFVQAMDMVRRQLGEAKRELEALRAVQARPGADPGAELVLAERLLVGLRNHTAAMALADTLAAGLGTREARLYAVNEEFTRFFAEDGAGGGGFLPVELARAGHPLLFLAVERMKVLWIDDAGADPRCARLFAGQQKPEPLSMVALLVNEGRGVWIAVRPRGASGWRAAEQVFAEAIARQSVAARVEEAKATETLVVYPPGGAHALWAQPNLPANPDKPMFREMVDSAAAGLFTLSRAGRFTYLNSAAEQLFGMAGGALLGQALIERAAAGEEEAVQTALQQVLLGAALEERDIHFRRASGGAVLMRLYLAPLQDEGGEPTGITGCVLDVTALRERELVLSRQEAVYRGIVEGAPQLLWSMDAIGCITFVNGVCSQIYGLTPEEIIGRSSTILCDAETAARDVERMALLMAGRACTGYRTTHRHKDGTPVPLVVVAARQVDSAGNVTGAVGLAIALGGEEGA